eukprot:jgi/Chlat1/2332/Chrsp17S02608
MVTRAAAGVVKERRSTNSQRGALYVEVDPLLDDTWRVDIVVPLLKNGAVGVIPTDTLYAFVCDLENREAVQRLYKIKNMEARKPLSILCRDFADIDEYTMGFPQVAGGQRNIFRTVRQCLPGPYTLILPASKRLPKQCVEFVRGTKGAKSCSAFASRKSVGVRMPADPVVQRILSQLDRPLIATSVRTADDDVWLLDPVEISDRFGQRGVDFVVGAGVRPAAPSTVIDFSEGEPKLLRRGKGDLDIWGELESHEDDSTRRNPYATVAADSDDA